MRRLNDLGIHWVYGLAVCISFPGGTGIVVAQTPDSEFSDQVTRLLDSLNAYKLSDPAMVVTVGEEILQRVPEQGNESLHFEVAMDCANAEKSLSKMDKAIAYCDRAIRLAQRLENKYLIYAFFTKATVFNVNEIVDSTIIYYQKVIELTPPGQTSFYLCNSFTGIGTVYWFIGNFEKAEEYLLKGVESSRGLSGDSRSFALAPLVQFYVQKNDSRYLQYLDSLTTTEFFSKTSPSALMSHFDSFLLLEDLPEDDKERRLTEVFNYHAKNRPVDGQVFFATMLAEHLMKSGKYSRADSILQMVLVRTRDQNRLLLEARILNQLYENCKRMHDLVCALEYIEQLLGVNQKVLEDQNRNAVHELNLRFEAAQKDHQISEQRILLQQEQREQYFFIALSVLGLALALLAFLYLRHRILLAKRIREQDRLLHEQAIAHLHQEKEFSRIAASLETRERERKRIARDLHDELGAALSSIHIYSSAAEKAVDSTPETTKSILRQISENSRQVMENMSDIVWAINTTGNGEMSLEKKLKNYGYDLLTHRGVNCHYEIAPDAENTLVDLDTRKNVLLIAKEAMNNIAKYSEATEAVLSLCLHEGSLRLTISDNGKGFSPEDKRYGNGLENMRKRTEEIGGRFSLDTIPGKGTHLQCDLPITTIRGIP